MNRSCAICAFERPAATWRRISSSLVVRATGSIDRGRSLHRGRRRREPDVGPTGDLVHGRPQRLHLLGRLRAPAGGFGDRRRRFSLDDLGLGAAPPAVRRPGASGTAPPTAGRPAPQFRVAPRRSPGTAPLATAARQLPHVRHRGSARTGWGGCCGPFRVTGPDPARLAPALQRRPGPVASEQRSATAAAPSVSELAAPALLVGTDEKLEVSHHAGECLSRLACPQQDRRRPLSGEPDVVGRCPRTRDVRSPVRSAPWPAESSPSFRSTSARSRWSPVVLTDGT